ncbi:hypothetical protein [Roseomonas populi]|uniref:Uncharacterized protein n=1 Tax=Roseomonas populi TaxID=3121582 RepID=A0ABT1X3J5_9PROT|nr:hypothetical protein [Roseomonas pecuniae]MCR0982679.1 hypothetical protein [Roseomonas pecuniae]
MRHATRWLTGLILSTGLMAGGDLRAEQVRHALLVSAVVRAPSCIASATERAALAVSCAGSMPFVAHASGGSAPRLRPGATGTSLPQAVPAGSGASIPWTLATLPESQGVIVVAVTY